MDKAVLPFSLLVQENTNEKTFPSPLVSLLALAPGDEQGGFSPLCGSEGLTEPGVGWEEQLWTDVQQQLSLSDRLQVAVGGSCAFPLLWSAVKPFSSEIPKATCKRAARARERLKLSQLFGVWKATGATEEAQVYMG